MFPESIETQRLLLRKPLSKDADSIFQAYAQDREVTRYLEWRPHASVGTTRAFIANCQSQWASAKAFPYVITKKDNGELLGMIEIRPNGHRANFGFVLARPYWGRGLMPEAASALVRSLSRSHPSSESRRRAMSKTAPRPAYWKRRGFRGRDCCGETSSIPTSRRSRGIRCSMQSQGELRPGFLRSLTRDAKCHRSSLFALCAENACDSVPCVRSGAVQRSVVVVVVVREDRAD